VVLMMENHSYDNYLGMLQGRGEGFPLGPGGKPAVSNHGERGEIIRAFPLPSPAQRCGHLVGQLAVTGRIGATPCRFAGLSSR
jgi:phospholipase C